jgi:hypothetical protein
MSANANSQWMMPEGSRQAMRLVQDEPQAEMTDTASFADEAADDSDARMQIRGYQMERRAFRRFNLESMGVSIERWDGRSDCRMTFGRVLDLSAGGIRLRTRQTGIRVDQQIRVRLELPAVCGISPFVAVNNGEAHPAREWTGWLAVARVQNNGDGTFDIGGRLVDMKAMDRGMLGLYLSTQPLAA